jgi:hypothetical protein
MRRFRASEAAQGRVRLEVTVDQKIAEAIQKLAPDWCKGAVIRYLLVSGLRLEGELKPCNIQVPGIFDT